MTTKYKGMLLASFAGDSLALGAHWIYDTEKIRSEIGRVDRLIAPLPNSYHKGKAVGEFTHYGDQTLLLLRSISTEEKFHLAKFASNWQQLMRNYSGYLDGATKETLANMDNGNNEFNSGSASSDLGGAARIAPLLYFYRKNLDVVLSYVREQTIMTHNSPAALVSAEFLCKITWGVLAGLTPREAIEKEVEAGTGDITLDLRIRNALENTEEKTEVVIKKCGQACSAENALPGVIHLVTAYQDNLAEALIENVMAGGDSAARGLATGMILGAHLGEQAIPQQWLSEMVAYKEILDQLNVQSSL